VALSRFGAFKGLKLTTSGLSEAYPGTKTLSFYGATYTSRYVSFLATEQCSDIPASSTSSAAALDCEGYKPLQSLPGVAARLFYNYDFQPYQPSANAGGIPFVDFGNSYVEDGGLIDPAVLAGLSHLQIARSLRSPGASPGQRILVGANYYSAIICRLTHDKPASVCKMPVVIQAAVVLKL